MKIHIIVTPCGTKIGDPSRLELRSVWNEGDQVEMEFGGVKFISKGSELIDSVKRIIYRPIFSRD